MTLTIDVTQGETLESIARHGLPTLTTSAGENLRAENVFLVQQWMFSRKVPVHKLAELLLKAESPPVGDAHENQIYR
jgi:hypothetical protein